MKPWLNRLRTWVRGLLYHLGDLLAADTEHLYDDDPVRYYRGRSGDDEEWPVHGEDPRI